jgi:hypothetical protein
MCAIRTLDERPSIIIKDTPIISSERMLHKEYYHKGSVEKKSLVVGLKAFFFGFLGWGDTESTWYVGH